MASRTFDNRWFHNERRRLLEHSAPGDDSARDRRSVRAVSRGSAARDEFSRRRMATTERMLRRLPERQEAAVRGHMQMYRSCLEATAFVPSDELVHAAVQIEWLWYTTPFKKFYRDHLAHVMKVALIGLELWQSKKSPFADGQTGESLVDRAARELARGELGCPALRQAARRCGNDEDRLGDPAFWRAVVLEATRIAGLLHDLAYPSIMAGKYVHPTASIADPLAMFALGPHEAAARVLDRFGDRLIAIPFFGYEIAESSRDAPGPGHRVFAELVLGSHSLQAGARILQFAADADRRWRLTPFEAFVIEWAALAASLHDYDKAFELHHEHRDGDERGGLAGWFADPDHADAIRPRYRRDPVSYMVALADQLQDFGRVNYHMTRGKDRAELRLRYPVESVTVAVEDGHATIRFALAGSASDAERASIQAHKAEAAAMIFGADGAEGWFDHSGLVDRVSLEVVSP